MSMENHGGDEADIEDQLPGPSSDAPSPETASTPQINPHIGNPVTKPDATHPTTFTAFYRFGLICGLARHIPAFPFIIFSICLNAYTRKLDGCLSKLLFGEDLTVLSTGETTSASDIKNKKKTPVANVLTSFRRLSMVITTRLGCLLSLWLVVNLSVSSFKRLTLFGCLLWKWSLLATVILLGYPFLFIIYLLLINLIGYSIRGSNMDYCIRGLESSMRLLIHFISILVVWLLCIRTNNGDLNRYGTLTLSSFLAGAVLMVVKSVALLWWQAKYIYRKYERKILAAGCQLYFLLLVMDQDQLAYDLLMVPWWDPSKQGKTKESGDNGRETENKADNNRRASRQKIPPIEEHMLKKNARVRQIECVAWYLMEHFELTLTEDDDMPNIVPNLRRRFASNPGQEFGILTTVYQKSGLSKSDAQLLLELLRLETSNVNPTYEEFEIWMVDGLKRCYAVGHRLNGALEVKRILARVLNIFIVAVVILIWLFVTGFATTKVVVGLASVFLGLTFMFGDACKTFFQGVIFSFVTHPFDVGDRCIIDDKKLEVKKINILTTAFFGDPRKDIVLYPNSDLATKQITILKGESEGEPEPAELKDLIELNLHSSTTRSQIIALKEQIEGFLEGGIKSGHYKGPYAVTLKEIGDSLKMAICFNHKLDNGDVRDQLESFQLKKSKQRSTFLLQIMQYLEDNSSANQDCSKTGKEAMVSPMHHA